MNSFQQQAEKHRQLARNQRLAILVWGPGEGSPGYEKRLQIRDELSKIFPSADVAFSEDRELEDIADYAKGQLLQEAIHALAADVVLILAMSRGSELELDHFIPTYSWFRDKAYVFLKKRYVASNGLVGTVLDKLTTDQVQGFSEEDFASCRLAKQMSVEVVDSVAMEKYLRGAT